MTVVTVTTPPEAIYQVPPYEIDTVKLSDQLHEIRNSVAVVDIAVCGMRDDAYADPHALSGLRDLLDAIMDRIAGVADTIHPPGDEEKTLRNLEAVDRDALQ